MRLFSPKISINVVETSDNRFYLIEQSSWLFGLFKSSEVIPYSWRYGSLADRDSMIDMLRQYVMCEYGEVPLTFVTEEEEDGL